MSDTSITPPPATAEADLSGQQLGDFRLLRRIGRGAMATVYLAEQLSLGRQVAVKVLKPELAADESYLKRFRNEARSAASLVHANIVQIHEVGQHEGLHFIAQEYVRGQNLKQLLQRSGPLETPQAVAVMRQVGAALHKAGKEGLIHRDIKPDNIMISAAGEVKVADFGLCRVSGDGGVDLTQAGITMGTPLYMSPEQAEGGTLDPRSDLYSFGVTCYHMLAGRPPFDGDTALAVAVQHVKNQPERLENIRPDLSGGLTRIVHKLLAKAPDDRFQSAAEMLQDLKALRIEGESGEWTDEMEDWSTAELLALSDARTAATQQLDVLMKTAALDRLQSRRGLWLIAATVIGALLLGGLFAWITREPPLLARGPGGGASDVEQRENAEAQYWHAMSTGREADFKAVWQHFPDETYYTRLAKQQLARQYAAEERFDEAMRLFTDLANLNSEERRPRAFGLAGQALYYHQQGDEKKAAAKLAEIATLELKPHLDPDMRRQIDRISQ